MSSLDFNPYREWLGLDVQGRRPDHYELLGLSRFEGDLDLIRSAVDARTNTVRHVRPGQNVEAWQRLLDELSQTRSCLTDGVLKQQYDEQLRQGVVSSDLPPKIESATVSNPLPPIPGAIPASPPPAVSEPVVPPAPPPLEAIAPGHMATPPTPDVPLTMPVTGMPGMGQAPYSPPGYYPVPGYPAPLPGGVPGSISSVPGYPPLAMAIPVAPAQPPAMPPGMMPGVYSGPTPSPYSLPPGAPTVPVVPPLNPSDPMAPVPGFVPGVFGQIPGYPQSASPGTVLPVGGLPGGAVPVGGLASGVTAVPAGDMMSPAPSVATSRRFLGRQRNQSTSTVIAAVVGIAGVGLIVLLFNELTRRNNANQAEPHVAAGEPDRAAHLPSIAPETPTPRVGPSRVAPTRKADDGERTPPNLTDDPPTDMPTEPSPTPKPDDKPAPGEPGVKEPAPMPKTEPVDPKPEPKPPTPDPVPATPPVKKPEPSVNDVAQMISALGLAKTALGERRLDEAKMQIEMASNLAKAANHKAMTRRMELLHHYVVEFWKAVRESLKTANMIDELEVGNTRVAIVSASEESLTIRAAGQNRTYEMMSLPAGVAMALANRWLDVKAPSSKIIRGAFHAVDPNGGDPAQARRLWEEAKLLGGDVDELMPVLDDKFDLASLPVTKATVRQGPTPTIETIAVAAKQVKEKYAKEISAAKNKEQKYALVKKLMDEASVEMPNESYRYALLAEARDQSAAAKFAQLLVQVVDEMERWFKIDALEVKYESLAKAAATSTPGNARDFAIECLALTEKAIADKRYDVAGKAAKVAHTTARRANDRDLAVKASDKAREIGELSGKTTKPLEKTKPNGKAKPAPKTPPGKAGEKPPFAKQMA